MHCMRQLVSRPTIFRRHVRQFMVVKKNIIGVLWIIILESTSLSGECDKILSSLVVVDFFFSFSWVLLKALQNFTTVIEFIFLKISFLFFNCYFLFKLIYKIELFFQFHPPSSFLYVNFFFLWFHSPSLYLLIRFYLYFFITIFFLLWQVF
jgi:hypothetical protein